MKIATFLTESHSDLYYNIFFRSLIKYEFEIPRVYTLKYQGGYGSNEFRAAMVQRVRTIRQLLDGDEIFIVSDVDIRFFRPFMRDLEERIDGVNALFQDNGDGSVCMGFCVLRPCDETRDVFDILEQMTPKFTEDQHAFNRLKPKLNFKLLPKELYWTHGYKIDKSKPLPQRPEGIIMQHANWCVGVETKMKLLTV